MLGRFFFIILLLVGGAAVALWATRSGVNVARSSDAETGAVICTYWLGFGLAERRHEVSGDAGPAAFECPILLRDVVL